ncbi:MAG: TatD family hydrolase [Patescibacteria group bacterium]|nr:TatD family hydrolase [Patescibacteria group bacterium]
MVDTHCHLNFHAFEKDRDEVIKSAFEKGVTKIINVGTKLDSSKLALELANRYDPPAGGIYAAVGIHPHHADKLEENWLDKLEELAKNPKVVAIGECGMDFFSYNSNGITNKNLQKDLFIKQIELSLKLSLPLQIHNRHAGWEILDVLKNYKGKLLNPPGMFHCFAGNKDFLKKVLEMGFYIGFDGNITYKGIAPGEETHLKELIKETPLDKILTETDSPFLSPIPFRGQKNKPEYVIIVGKFIAQIKGLEFEEVQDQTTKNADTLFKLNIKS